MVIEIGTSRHALFTQSRNGVLVSPWFWVSAGIVLIGGALLFAFRSAIVRAWRAAEARRAREDLRRQRERVEAKFFDLASRSGKPKGLRWVGCDWLDGDVILARESATGLLTALAHVNLRFEAIEGGDMEDVEAVGTVRDAAAVFHYRDGVWSTGGRALFNMPPTEAIERLAGQYEPLAEA